MLFTYSEIYHVNVNKQDIGVADNSPPISAFVPTGDGSVAVLVAIVYINSLT